MKDLETLIALTLKYVNAKDDFYKSEVSCTEKELAESVLNEFVDFLVANAKKEVK